MNIARASLRRRTVVLFLCVLTAVAGVAAYFQIGKLEDPAFTIKTAVVTILYPGSTAYEVEREVTSRVEDAVQSMGEVKHIRSRSVPGLAIVYVDIKDEYSSQELPQVWDVLRQKLYDVQANMPSGSTILRRSARARSRSACSNMSGVTALGASAPSAATSTSRSTCRSKSASAVSTLRREPASSRPRVCASAFAA